jgi:hypothetical protein
MRLVASVSDGGAVGSGGGDSADSNRRVGSESPLLLVGVSDIP